MGFCRFLLAQCSSVPPHFFLPPAIFALIASASAFCFFICSFWAKEPSSSSLSSSFLPLAATGSKPGQMWFGEWWRCALKVCGPFLLTTFFCDLLVPSPAPLIGCAGAIRGVRA